MRNSHRLVVGLAIGLLAVGSLTGCDLLGGGTPDPSTTDGAGAAQTSNLSAEDAAFIDGAVTRAMGAQQIPGVTVSLTAPGKTFLRSYGVADKTSGRKLTPDDRFRISSVTKTFVATAVLRLVDQGALALDATIEGYVPGVPNGNVITIRQLLSMRSGVFSFVEDQEFRTGYEADPLLPSWKPADILPILQRNPPKFEPGARTEYSETNYVLLGMVLERLTQQTVEQVIEEYVVRPLGLGVGTTFPTTAAMPEPFTRGYGDGRDLTASNPRVPWAAGGMVSTVPDLTRYAKLLATGALLNPNTHSERMKLGLTPNPGGPPVGYGLGVATIGNWVGHNGSIFGYGNVVLYLPQLQVTIVVMTNQATTTAENATGLFLELAQHFYPDSIQP